MSLSFPMHKAVRILRQGGVIAYPTEGVFGLGCLPAEAGAVSRILAIKQRDPASGLILIASSKDQLVPWARLPAGAELPSSLEHPVTWLVPAQPSVPYRIRGAHDTIAVRLTAHPVAAALCDAAGSALVSTSANVTGRPPARSPFVLRRRFGRLVDYVLPGRCGAAGRASEIRDLESGRVLRAGER
jgi:L-threonylcarbamoyladenylate synthase